MRLDGATTGEAFLAYVERVLAPNLRPSGVVAMDNLGVHKGAAIRDVIRAAGVELRFLPPHSPALNLIERAYAKLKALLRKAAERTSGALWTTVAETLVAFAPDECPQLFHKVRL